MYGHNTFSSQGLSYKYKDLDLYLKELYKFRLSILYLFRLTIYYSDIEEDIQKMIRFQYY